jgi:hypothetical protein
MSEALRKAAEQALACLEDVFGKNKVDVGAINDLRAALEDTEQSVPVLYIDPDTFSMAAAHVGAWKPGHEIKGYIPLYTAPPHWEPQCKWPTCKTEEYPQMLCKEIEQSLGINEQEPVAWMTEDDSNGVQVWLFKKTALRYSSNPTPLYTAPSTQTPPTWWPAIEAIMNEYGLQAIDFVADWRKANQAAGLHPAPCAKHCEAKSFQIEIRRLTNALKLHTTGGNDE